MSLAGQAAAGIFDGGFETYRTLKDDDYQVLLNSGLIVLDTNALLNFYRYHAITRKDLTQALTHIGERLWVPHQAMYEFWERRLGVISSRSNEVEEIIAGLNKSSSSLEGGIRRWANRVGLRSEETTEIVSIIEAAVSDVTRRIRDMNVDDSFKDAEDTTEDPVVSALASILKSNIGNPLPVKELQEAKIEARLRIKEKRAPGWKDSDKESPEGDYIIWRQTLQEAKRRGLDVLFVTGDVKEDWWRKEHGEAKGPLAELVYEMRTEAGVNLFMMRPGSFLFHAGNAFGLNVDQESIQDAQRVSSSVHVGWNVESHEWPETARTILNLLESSTDRATYGPLSDALVELSGADSQSLDIRLMEVWKVIDIAISVGLMGPRALPSIDETTSKIRDTLGRLHSSSIETWLIDIASEFIEHATRAPQAFSYTGRFPPLVINVYTRSTQRGEFDEIQFVADIENGGEISISRFVKLDERRFWLASQGI